MRSSARRRAKLMLARAVAMLLLLMLQGCSDRGDEPLRLGASLWPGYEPLHLAAAQGYFKTGSVVLVDSASPQGSIQGLRNGDLDAVALTLDEVLLLHDQGVLLKIILVLDFSNGGDAILARKGIQDVAALKGKRIGLESLALGTYMLSRALALQGLSLSDVETQYLSVSEHRQALQHGEVDAVVSFDPVRSELMASGAVELFSSRDIAGEIVDVLAVRQSYLAAQPQRVREVVGGWYRALDFMAAQPGEAAVIAGRRWMQSPAEVLAVFSTIKLPDRNETLRLMSAAEGHEAPLAGTVRQLAESMQQQQIISGEINPAALITPDYLK